MSEFKGIPIVRTAPAASGQKYVTPQGFTAIRDGIKQTAAAEPLQAGRKPRWLRRWCRIMRGAHCGALCAGCRISAQPCSAAADCGVWQRG